MDARELRIGGFVNCKISNDKGTYKVLAIPEWENQPEQPITIDRCPKQTVSISQLKPIPLTEEWLLKMGFEKRIDRKYERFSVGKFELEYYSHSDDVIDGFYFYCEHVKSGDVKIPHIHQLQNLYFAITGEELTIKK